MTDLTSAVPGLPLPTESVSDSRDVSVVSNGLPAPILAGILFALLGVGFIWFGLEYRLGTPRSMGPGMFPVMGGVLLAALGLIVAAAGIRSSERVSSLALRPLLATIGSVALFALLIERAGLVVSAPLLIVGVILATGQGSWKLALAVAVPLTAATIAVFPYLLGVPLKVLP